MTRGAILLLALAAAVSAAPTPATVPAPVPEYVQAVEFPYYLFPRNLWERELVWLKNLGFETIEFSIPWNWHQLDAGDFDFTGSTSPRRDIVFFLHTLRKLGLRAWVKPLPPVAGWLNNGLPSNSDAAAQQVWLKQLADLLAPQTAKHGGPIAFVEGHALAIDAAAPPAPVAIVSATDAAALIRSRQAIATGRGALLWVNVEPSLYPAGWAAPAATALPALFRPGAVDFSGQELRPTTGLRRDAALLRNWAAFLPRMHAVPVPRALPAKPRPASLKVRELISEAASAVSVINEGTAVFHNDLRVLDPVTRRAFMLPGVEVAPGNALWLPLRVSLGNRGPCRECSNFSSRENIIYATAELLTVEFENGILAMEFAAPQPGVVVLQLAREPEGPYLAAGKPTKFEWDDKTLRVRMNIPAGRGEGNRVRIGLAIEAPETSGFFNEAKRLIIGQQNLVSTEFSSPDVASRSRLLTPEGFTAQPSTKSPNEIDYAMSVPAEALHGDYAPLTLEADGVPLGRARPQLLRPVSIRLAQAISLHFGPAALAVDPPTAPVESRGGSDLEFVVRNNSEQIQTYRLEAVGEGLEFSPPKTEISIGATEERTVRFRVFGAEGASGLKEWMLHVHGGAEADLPMRVVLLPRNGEAVWSADLDGDGYPEWVLESAKVRAVFSSRDGGRWMEMTWKDTGANFLPAEGALAQPGPVKVRAVEGRLEFEGSGWTRTARIDNTGLTIEQPTPLPADGLAPVTSGNLRLAVRRSAQRVTYSIEPTQP